MVYQKLLVTALCACAVATSASPPDHKVPPTPPSYGPPKPPTPPTYAPPKPPTPPPYGPPKPPSPPTYGPPKPPVNSKKLQDSIVQDNLSKKAGELQKCAYDTADRNRVFGSPGHENTLDFISGYLDKHSDYFTYTRQPFVALYSQASGSLLADGVDQGPSVYSYSPSTPDAGNVTSNFVAVSNLGCAASDYPAAVEGAIALISRGECEFGKKSALAGAAGAAAAVIYDNIESTTTLSGTLGAPPRPEGDYVPTVGITLGNGTRIRDALAAGQNVAGTILVDSIIQNRTTYNIIADTIGGDHNNVLQVGGHSDSVFAGPGINDDGSGIIGILEVAEQLTKYSTKNAVRFSFWSAEEFGLLGSEHYVQTLNQTEQAKIRLYLNFDMIASPNYVLGIYDGDGSKFGITGPPGSAQAEKVFEDFFAANGLSSVPSNFSGRSDYGPFLDVGIPSGGLFTGAEEIKTEEEARLFGGEAGVAYDVNYHQVGDTYDNLNFEAFLWNTKAIAAAVAEYSSSFDSLPARNASSQELLPRSLEPSGGKRNGCHGHDHDEHTI